MDTTCNYDLLKQYFKTVLQKELFGASDDGM